jgi:hypothetical protein
MKLKWQDPEYRAKMKERDRIRLANFDPKKYSRAGVPDGMTRAMAEPLWERARELADQFIQTLKDTGQL